MDGITLPFRQYKRYNVGKTLKLQPARYEQNYRKTKNFSYRKTGLLMSVFTVDECIPGVTA